MAVQKDLGITAEEYLARERASTGFRSEFWDGRIMAMSGARRGHVKIVSNLMFALTSRLGKGLCDVYCNDLRVAADVSGRYFYPDVVIACEGAQFLDEQLDTLLNPVVVIEVLSDSTESVDKSVKLDAYRAIPSLTDCVLVDSRSMTVDHYRREGPATWLVTTLTASDQRLELQSVSASVPLAEVYERVELNKQ
jgi:Uma2 family endonuclease